MADLVPMSQAATTSLVTTLQNTDLFALAREDDTSETGYRSKVSRVDALAKKVVNETDYSQLQTTDKKIIGAINEVNAKASKFDNMTATASGSIATFTDGGDDIPVSEYECEIVAQQASGTPTPSSPLSITGFSQADIVVCGKNLAFDHIDNCNIDANGNLVVNNSYKMYIAKVEQGKTYSTNLGSLVGGYFDKIPVISDGSFDGTRVVTTSTFTATHTGFIAFRASSTDTQVSLKEGTDTTYAPYTGNTYIVEFSQTIYGGRLIYKNGQWSIEATHGYFTYDGNENWVNVGGQYPFAFYLDTLLTDMKTDDISGNLSNMFPWSLDSVPSNNAMHWQNPTNTGRIYVYDYDHSGDLASFKAMLNNTSLQAAYKLATPVIIPISSSTRVKTISGVNNIYSNTGDNSVKYFTENADSLAELVKAFVL